MRRFFGAIALGVGLLACGASAPKSKAQIPTQVVIAKTDASGPALPPPAPDDPLVEWHTYSPKPLAGGPFYRVVDLNVSAPSMQGGPCSLSEVEGATFLECGSIARVDGDRIDTSFPSPSATTRSIVGRYPDDLWAETYEGSYDDGYRPPPDRFSEGDVEWHHLEDGKWKTYATSDARHPYVGGSSLFFAMPPVPMDRAAKRPKSCADYACFGVLPRVLTNGTTKPDFSALKDRIAWIHHYDVDDEEGSNDFAFVVDPSGPVFVFMRAFDLKSNKKGFGLARWTPAQGATFEWLPSSVAFKKKLSFFDGAAKDGKVEIGIAGDASTWLENDGKKWRESAARTPNANASTQNAAAQPTGNERFVVEDSRLVERLPDGSTKDVPGIEDTRFLNVVTRADGDTWVFTMDGVYRTVRPTETLYRTETFGSLHPFPKPLHEGEQCAHPFAILDATEKHRASDLRQRAWDWSADLEPVELEILDHVVVGVPVDSLEKGQKILDDNHDYGSSRMMEGAPHHVVCAKPVGARPFVSTMERPNG